MSKEIRNRLVRGTIHNMVTVASSSPFDRFPTHSELEEMSKSLVIRYTCLRDSETGHVSIIFQHCIMYIKYYMTMFIYDNKPFGQLGSIELW